MSRVVFRRIRGRIIPIIEKLNDKADQAAIAAHKRLAQRAGEKMNARIDRSEIKPFTRTKQFKSAIIRKLPEQTRGLHEFRIEPKSVFARIDNDGRWSGLSFGNDRGFTYAKLKRGARPPFKPSDVEKIGVGSRVRSLSTVSHELGHAQQFKEASRLTQWRYAKRARPTIIPELLHETDAYWRGANMFRGNARRVLLKRGAARMILSPKYGPTILKAGAAAGAGVALAGLGGLALWLKSRSKSKTDQKAGK